MGDKLLGRVVLITGAAQGIGSACAECFAHEGAFVFISDIDREAGQRLVDTMGSQAAYVHLDVRDEGMWQAAMQQILMQKGRWDVLINNAGITGFVPNIGPQDPEHASLESWKQVHAVNLEGVFLGCKTAISAMKHQGGSIINMSSRSGLVGIPGAAAYASSKAGVRNHTKSVALYCAEQGYPIRCNSIHPAAILTPMWDAMLGTGEDRMAHMAEIAQSIPMKRMGQPEEVAQAALFLASEASSYITGIELTIDGGLLAGSSASPRRAR